MVVSKQMVKEFPQTKAEPIRERVCSLKYLMYVMPARIGYEFMKGKTMTRLYSFSSNNLFFNIILSKLAFGSFSNTFFDFRRIVLQFYV